MSVAINSNFLSYVLGDKEDNLDIVVCMLVFFQQIIISLHIHFFNIYLLMVQFNPKGRHERGLFIQALLIAILLPILRRRPTFEKWLQTLLLSSTQFLYLLMWVRTTFIRDCFAIYPAVFVVCLRAFCRIWEDWDI